MKTQDILDALSSSDIIQREEIIALVKARLPGD